MKLNHLNSTTQTLSHDNSERSRHAADDSVLRVNAMEGIAGDRQRSVQQEINAIDPRAIGSFQGGQRILAEAHELAAALSALGGEADLLIKPSGLNKQFYAVDEEI